MQITVAEAIESTLTNMQHRLKPSGFVSMRSHAKMFTGLFGDRLLPDLKRNDVQAFVAHVAFLMFGLTTVDAR